MFKVVIAIQAIYFLAVIAGQANAQCRRRLVEEGIRKGMKPHELKRLVSTCEVAGPPDDIEATDIDVIEPVPVPNWSTWYEEITSCGYQPQRKELVCPIKIKQDFGYGGPPALQPSGSFEYVQFCISCGARWRIVNVNGVHVHDDLTPGSRGPPFMMAAVIPVNEAIFDDWLDGHVCKAQATLSWAIPPGNDCSFRPIWGNTKSFLIRFDP